MKEYNYIRCREVGIEYKKLVRSYGEFFWGKAELFIHKSSPAGYPYCISEKRSGMAVICGLKTPTVRAAKLYLAKNLTDEQDKKLDRYTHQRLLRAYHRRKLEDLPHKRQVRDQILRALEGEIVSGDPF